MNGINATSINVTTNEMRRASLKFVCGDVPGNTTIAVTAGSATASIPITVKDVPFLSATVSVEPESLNSGDVVSVAQWCLSKETCRSKTSCKRHACP